MKILKHTAVLLAAVMCIAAAGCNKTPAPDNAEFDRSGLYGMCYLLEERDYDGEYDMAAEVEIMKNLGVKSVRQWMHFTNLMTDKETLKEDECEEMHELLRLCSEAGMINIGMNHHNFNGGTNSTGKPYERDIGNADYVAWLDDYYTSWYTLASEFPEVKYWEIDNEVNNGDFMKNAEGQDVYDQQQMADIATDMFYYATRAIHDANPSAKSIMGGLTEPAGLGKGTTGSFLQKLYDNIASGEFGYFYGKETSESASADADDYFEVACWHPYVWGKFNADYFVEVNNEYYQIILDNECKHKEVVFSEVGFNDVKSDEASATLYLEEMFEAIEERMPYVTMVHYYKLFDVGLQNSWEGEGTYSRFGLFYDPDHTRVYPLQDGSANAPNGGPKSKAYKFQELAGGSGSLDLLMKSAA